MHAGRGFARRFRLENVGKRVKFLDRNYDRCSPAPAPPAECPPPSRFPRSNCLTLPRDLCSLSAGSRGSTRCSSTSRSAPAPAFALAPAPAAHDRYGRRAIGWRLHDGRESKRGRRPAVPPMR